MFMLLPVQRFVHPVFGAIFVLLFTHPNIRWAEIIGETMSDKQGMKVFSMLALIM